MVAMEMDVESNVTKMRPAMPLSIQDLLNNAQFGGERLKELVMLKCGSRLEITQQETAIMVVGNLRWTI